jgi:hypothetical protein
MMIRYNSPNPPTYLHELDWSKAIIAARIVVEYSDVNFGPQIQSSPEAAQRSYEAAIQFRKNSVYFLMRKDDTTQLEYYHMSSSSYRKKDIWRSKKDKNSGLNSTGMAYCKYVPGYAYCK